MLNRTFPRIRPHELIIIASTIGLMLVIRYRLNRELEPYWGFDVVTAFLEVIILLSVIAMAVQALLKRNRAKMLKYLRYQRRLASILDLLRHMFIIGLTIYVYTWLKIFIPLLNVKLYDQQLYNIDNLIHLGVNPNRFLIALFPYPWFLHFLDFEYKQYHISVLCGVAWFLVYPSRSERCRFIGAFSMLWLVGALLYVTFPSLGPCYTLSEDYTQVRKEMPTAAEFQALLFHHYNSIREPQNVNEVREAIPVFGVAAFPSLHVGAQLFLALWARKRNRIIYLIFLLFTFFTFITSLISGWHYAVDGYAGAALALLFAWIYDRRPSRVVTPARV